MQILDCGKRSFRIVSRHSRSSSGAAADRNIECLVTLRAQFVQRDVLADLDAGLDLNAHLSHHVDLCLNDILLELVGRNTVAQHTACHLILLKNSRAIAFFCQIERCGKSCRTTADDCDLL